MSAITVSRFRLQARVSSDRPDLVRPVLAEVFPGAKVRPEGSDFVIEADVVGPGAKELNRAALSALRRAEKRTRLRAEWTEDDGTRYRFFDYVLKAMIRP